MRLILTVLALALALASISGAAEFYVSPSGNDQNPGTKGRPFLTLDRAHGAARPVAGNETVRVYLRAGKYRISDTLVFKPEDSGAPGAPHIWSAYPGETVAIVGSAELTLDWTVHGNGIQKANVPAGLEFDQLFVNGERQTRARFPNYDPVNPLRTGAGYVHVVDGSNRRPDTWFSYNPETFTKRAWSDPSTGIVHAFQSHNWGNLQYRIKSIDRETHRISLSDGGWQLQRAYGIGKGRGSSSPFYVDNIFEELDSPGEWFLDTKTSTLYFMPPRDVNLATAQFEGATVKDLIQFRGSSSDPVHHITMRGLHFSQARATFMEHYEPLARGDWAIHRGGAIYLEGAEDIRIEDSNFEYLGGNAVFMSGYNRRNIVTGCRFFHTGESAVAIVGLPSAVRLYMTWDDQELHNRPWNELRKSMDLGKGPKSPGYPQDCRVENSVMYELGDYGKQVAGVFISMSHRITVSHATIYNLPRAGICINDGTWGGHVIEHCDIWETVRDTGEHGPFNSWGRERQWLSGRGGKGAMEKDLVFLDAIDTVHIRHNRIANFRKTVSAGNWTIDLDDGSSNFHIYDNLSLGSTLKLRDGFFRKVWNNIHVSPVELGWHVWPEESGDEFFHNITVVSGARPGQAEPTIDLLRPARMPEHPWGKRMDNNLYWIVNTDEFRLAGNTWDQWRDLGYDRHSVFADPLFVDPLRGDYRVREDSPALKVGFRNFPMTGFGHQMTRIAPFGGEFEDQVTATITPDARGGEVRYTTDGSIPTLASALYTEPLAVSGTTTLKARTFQDGLPVGFTEEATFKKVPGVERPSWLRSLLAGRWTGSRAAPPKTGNSQEWFGGSIRDIEGDDDLIDATGGQDYGVFLESVPATSDLATWGLKPNDIIISLDGVRVDNIARLKEIFADATPKTLTVRRGYDAIRLVIRQTAR